MQKVFILKIWHNFRENIFFILYFLYINIKVHLTQHLRNDTSDQIFSNKFCINFTEHDFALQYYVDGGFSSMQPSLSVPCNEILTVCPFSGEMDICPADTPSMWNMVVSGSTLKGNMANSIRIFNALYPTTVQVKRKPWHQIKLSFKSIATVTNSNDLKSQ